MGKAPGQSLTSAIHAQTDLKITGDYKRYRSKKWRFRVESEVPTPANDKPYLLFSAEFNDKNGDPYTFVVAVNCAAETITPISDFEPDLQQVLWDNLGDLKPRNQPRSRQQPPTTEHRIWLAEMASPTFARHKDSARPQLVIGTCRSAPVHHIQRLNSELSTGSGQIYRPRADLLEALPQRIRGQNTYTQKKAARNRKKIIRQYFKDDGYVIGVGGDPRDNLYTVYVIDLKDTVGKRKNPGSWVYVGETAIDPEERLQQHLNGYKASPHVRKHGLGLNDRLMKSVPQARFRQDSEFLEKEHAARLMELGFNVKGGH